MVAQGLYCFVHCPGDNNLYDVAIRGWIHLNPGGRGLCGSPTGPTRALHQGGGCPRAMARDPYGHGHVVDHSLLRGCEVGAFGVVSLLHRGRRCRAPCPPSASGVWSECGPESRNSCLAQTPCRIHCRTRAVCQECADRVTPGQPCFHGPQSLSVWAWRDMPVMCLCALTNESVIGRVYFYRRARGVICSRAFP